MWFLVVYLMGCCNMRLHMSMDWRVRLRVSFYFLWLSLLSLVSFCFSQTSYAASSRIKAQYQLCKKCHGLSGEGRYDIQTPAIAGLPAWYITAQLKKFRNGARGKHPQDINGVRMRPMSRTLKEKDIAGIAEYVAKLKPTQPALTVKGNIAKGEVAYAVCKACHGPNAEGNQTLNAPPLGMMNDWYLISQLKNFQHGIRGFDAVLDPTGASMVGMAQTLKTEQAMKDVVSYIFSIR